MNISNPQNKAINHIRSYALSKNKEAEKTISHICGMSNLKISDYENIKKLILEKTSVVLHFHPYRILPSYKTVIDSLLEDGIYRNQYETNISNGGLFPFKGGLREEWEKKIFGEKYIIEGRKQKDCPKYGALDFKLFSEGPSPRFGSAYLVLDKNILPYCTFTYNDSSDEPKGRGVADKFDVILAELLSEIFTREYFLGKKDINISEFFSYIKDKINSSKPTNYGRNLNHYIEVQIHCDINLLNYATHLVCDSSFKNTKFEEKIIGLGKKNSLKHSWYPGFQIKIEDIPDNFRGPFSSEFAKIISTSGYLNSISLADFEKNYFDNEAYWKQEYPDKNLLQELKYLWHILVKFG